MSRCDSQSTRIIPESRYRDNTSMQTTQSYIEAHRFITPRSTRAHTEPNHNIDSNLIGIMNEKTPNRIERLLRTKGISSPDRKRKSSVKYQAELFDKAYFRERERVITQVENQQMMKNRLRQKLGLIKKPNLSFIKLDRNSLCYFQTKFRQFSKQGRYKQRLHPVCWLYEQYQQRASRNPASMENPFSNERN